MRKRFARFSAVTALLAIMVTMLLLQGGAGASGRPDQAGEPAAESEYQQAISLELQRDWDGALTAARQAVAIDPYTAKYVDKEARLAGFRLIDALTNGDSAAADALAAELLALEASWAERPAEGRSAKLDESTLLRFGQAHFLSGNLAAAEQLLSAAARTGLLKTEAEVWLYALYEQQGDAGGLKRLATKPWVLWRSWNPVYQAIKG